MESISIEGSACCSLPAWSTAEAPLELLTRVLGMLGVLQGVRVVLCASYPCGCVAAVAVVVNSARVNVFIRYIHFRTEPGEAPISYITSVLKMYVFCVDVVRSLL